MTVFNSTQPSFSAGIISTELFSRIDFNKLLSGVKQCENWEIRPAGGATYRTGTKFLAEVKDSTKEVNLIDFPESQDRGYCLEFGHNYIRFYKNGERIENGGTPVEVATTYTGDEIKELKYAQNKNQLFIAHKNHCPAVLTRNSDTSWTLTDMVFTPNIPTVGSVTIAKQTAKESDTIVNYDRWQYAVAIETSDGNEGLATKSNIISSDIDLANQNIVVSFDAPEGITAGSNFIVYRIYRGEFFFVYKIPYVSGTTSYSLKDISFPVDTTRAIREAFSGFANSNYPAAVTFWNQRLVFANTTNKPNAIYGSCVGVYDDFTTTILNNEDEAFELELNSGTNDEITDLVPMDDLIVMTRSKIWRVTGTSPSNMNAYIESYSGVSGIRPFVYKKSILYVDSSYNTISNFIYSYELNGYVGQNLDTLCRDLLDGHTVKSVSFRDTPYGILYCVRSDGVLLGLTYLKEENIYAWHKHTTDGQFLNVCAVNRPIYDQVYVIVKRGNKKYVELFQDHINVEQGIDDCWHLDCASRYISNVYKWMNESQVATTRTFYAYSSSGGTTTTRLYCWRDYFGRAYYNYSSSSYDKKNMLATWNRSQTTNFSDLSKVSVDTSGPGNNDLKRYSAGDFDYVQTYPATYPTIYVLSTSVGSTVYTRDGDVLSQVGTITSFSDSKIGFDSLQYTRDSQNDYTEGSSTTEITYLYTNGQPSVGSTTYRDVGLTQSEGSVTAVEEEYITVDYKNYALIETGTGVTNTVTGLSRFAGMAVSVLADGNEYKDVDVIDDAITLDREYANILVGLPYTGVLEPIPVDIKFQDTGTTVGLNRRINKATIRYFRTRGLWYGTSLNKIYQIKPYQYKDIGEDIPLETNVLNVEVTDTYKTESSFIIVQKSPFPALVQSITLGITYGEKN